MKLSQTQALLDTDGNIIGGKWELDKKHGIQYRTRGAGGEVKLHATLLDIASDKILFTHTTRLDGQKVVTRIHELHGIWQSDAKNRLTFLVSREQGRRDVLTFRNAWKMGDRHQLEYSFRNQDQNSKATRLQTLVFQGYWDILQKNRITYFLRGDSSSYFRFRGTFQTPSILAKQGEIRYQAGVEIENRVRTKNITLFGKWKYSRDLGLHFEVLYRNGIKKRMVFGGDFHVAPHHTITVALTSREGKPLGAKLVVTKRFLKTAGKAFLSIDHLEEDPRIEAGIQFKW